MSTSDNFPPAPPVHPAGNARKRGPFWARIVEGRWVFGVCTGLAARTTSISLDWIRALVVILALVTGGAAIPVLYVILGLMLPEVDTVEEYHRLTEEPYYGGGNS